MAARRRPGGESSDGPGRRWTGLFERLVFSVMGPPELGADEAPAGYRPDPAQEICPRCQQPWDAHERVRTSSSTYLRCPGATG